MATSKPKRRVVKQAPTVRQQAEQASQAAASEKKVGVLRLTLRFIGAPFRWIGRQIAKLSKFKVFRFIGRILWPTYFRNSIKELKQVIWPTGRETRRLTTAVIIFAISFGVLIALEDYVLDKLFKEVLLK